MESLGRISFLENKRVNEILAGMFDFCAPIKFGPTVVLMKSVCRKKKLKKTNWLSITGILPANMTFFLRRNVVQSKSSLEFQ